MHSWMKHIVISLTITACLVVVCQGRSVVRIVKRGSLLNAHRDMVDDIRDKAGDIVDNIQDQRDTVKDKLKDRLDNWDDKNDILDDRRDRNELWNDRRDDFPVVDKSKDKFERVSDKRDEFRDRDGFDNVEDRKDDRDRGDMFDGWKGRMAMANNWHRSNSTKHYKRRKMYRMPYGYDMDSGSSLDNSDGGGSYSSDR